MVGIAKLSVFVVVDIVNIEAGYLKKKKEMKGGHYSSKLDNLKLRSRLHLALCPQYLRSLIRKRGVGLQLGQVG